MAAFSRIALPLLLLAALAAVPCAAAAPPCAPTATPAPPASPLSRSDAAEITAACSAAAAATGSRPPDGGPASGRLVTERRAAALSPPLLAVDGDYVVTATFVNPDVASDRPWDFGFALMEPGPAGRMRYAIAVDSLADVYRVVGDHYVRAMTDRCAVDAAPGARNALQLIVLEDRAVLLVNGQPIAPFFLPTGATTGTLQAFSGLFVEDEEAGRTVAMEEASAWSLAE